MNKIIFITGDSGTGKTTLANYLEETYQLKQVQSYTTRKPRGNNEKGHTFIDYKDIPDILENDQIAAISVYNKELYFTTFSQIIKNDIYVVDPPGISFYFNSRFNEIKEPFVIHLCTRTDVKIERLRKRGSSDTEIVNKILNDAKNEMKFPINNIEQIFLDNSNNNVSIEEIFTQVFPNFLDDLNRRVGCYEV